jgi:hypothetical protein
MDEMEGTMGISNRADSNRMNKRAIMRASNKRAVEQLERAGHTDITLRTHCKHKDFLYNLNKGATQQTDFFNLFDGFSYDHDNVFTWLQFKTNKWAAERPIKEFVERRKQPVIVVNVTNKSGHWETLMRRYKIENGN